MEYNKKMHLKLFFSIFLIFKFFRPYTLQIFASGSLTNKDGYLAIVSVESWVSPDENRFFGAIRDQNNGPEVGPF